jgi:hypothetical protein
MPASTNHRLNDNASVIAQLDAFLKNSDYFHDVMKSHREAVAALLADFLHLLLQSSVLEPAALLARLSEMDRSTGHPSDDSTRRVLIAAIRDRMQQSEPAKPAP